ncbi:hypothetical protein [Aliivibrio fischeri]|uniref:hypothetical protein n=1 Tax=Aliivibrio fischeri TaxID=668 RepID=UPI00084C7405|nr:hypothetical protein [Aliivibrio fischeri]OED52898.1 hypothetical protein BEI47_18765 [Aliivibrio fischeri]
MTTQTIKENIAHATELANQLRQAIAAINHSACEAMSNKEKESLSTTEEALLSEMVTPNIHAATELYGRLVGLDNIYNKEA